MTKRFFCFFLFLVGLRCHLSECRYINLCLKSLVLTTLFLICVKNPKCTFNGRIYHPRIKELESSWPTKKFNLKNGQISRF